MRRPLLLQGQRDSGTASVGRQLADSVRRPFVELAAGDGDLRDLLQAAPESAPVVALAADALIDRAVRVAALDAAVVITLEPSSANLAQRAAYAEAHARIATEGRSAEALAAAAEQVWRRDPIAVAVGERTYCVDVGRSIVEGRLSDLVSGSSRLLLVSDDVVSPLHAARLDAAIDGRGIPRSWIALPHGEENKRVASLELIWAEAHACGVDRKSLLIALGGGVVTDVAGFAAATWVRGIPWIAVPTTLLAMVDASVGGKTAIDFLTAKNAVGAFWQPNGVVCDVDFLATEPRRGFVGALAEVVKTAIIGDPTLFELIESDPGAVLARDPNLVVELVRRSVRVKANIVGRDEREGGLRALLNLGHTLGHAFEAQGGYRRLSHGEAIAVGLVAALGIGVRLGVTPAPLLERVRHLLGTLGLPCDPRAEPLVEASALLGHDKKKAGSRLNFIVARELGQVEPLALDLVELEQLARGLAR